MISSYTHSCSYLLRRAPESMSCDVIEIIPCSSRKTHCAILKKVVFHEDLLSMDFACVIILCSDLRLWSHLFSNTSNIIYHNHTNLGRNLYELKFSKWMKKCPDQKTNPGSLVLLVECWHISPEFLCSTPIFKACSFSWKFSTQKK